MMFTPSILNIGADEIVILENVQSFDKLFRRQSINSNKIARAFPIFFPHTHIIYPIPL